MARYLVTGGCGFIGSHLTRQLMSSGHDVVVVDNLSTGKRSNLPSDANLIVEDLLNVSSIWNQVGNIDGCFHLAAVASVQKAMSSWHQSHLINLSGFINLMEMIAESDRPSIPIVYASSAAVYGNNTNLPLTEQSETLPISAYGADKLGSESHARAGSINRGLCTIGLRFFNVYGPNQDPSSPYSGVISIFGKQALERQAISVYGDGEQSRDFIYIDDVVSALIAASAMQGERAEVVNVCTGQATTLNNLISVLDNTMPYSINVQHVDAKAGDIRHSLGNASKMAEVLGISAKTEFAEGLHKTLAWMKSQ